MNVPACALLTLVSLAPSAFGAPAGPLPRPQEQAPDPSATLEANARRAMEEGRYEDARRMLDEILGAQRLREAREHFAGGNPQDGMVAVDAALEYRPGHPESLLVRAEGSLMLAEEVVASGGGALFAEGAFQDALAAFQAVPVSGAEVGVRVLFGASRAAYFLGRGDEALGYARQGMALLEGGPEVSAATEALAVIPERTWAEASFLAYRDARSAEAADDASALFLETRDALERLLARAPQEPWVWTQLARLDQWEGRLDEATARLQRGLDHVPDDSGLLQVLVEVASARGGAEATLAELNRFLERHPGTAMGHWYRARTRFDDALTRLLDGDTDAAAFREAEQDFVRCREQAPEHTASCQGYEVVCRDAIGWCLYNEGDYPGAREAFFSMEEVFDGGLEWALEGQLLSGTQGLEFVAQAFNDQQDWAAAAAIFDRLRELRPTVAKWANNAGFFHRDAGVPLEAVGRALCAAAEGGTLPGDLADELARVHPDLEATPSAYRALSQRYIDKAREHMRASYAAYLDAARLSPDDVRIVNDTALIAVYYLHEDLERAEQMLRQSIEMGAEQLRTRELSDEERYDLENAYGDAYQNLGVLLLRERGDREEAKRVLAKSLELGDSRPLVRERLLPLCDAPEAELEASQDEGLREWGLGCN